MTNDNNRGPGRPEGTTIDRRRYMANEELDRFMKAARKAGAKYDLFFSLVYYYALRVAEAVSLGLEDFHTEVHQVTIRAVKGGRDRTYDLPEQIEHKYRRWLKVRAKLEAAEENPFVFPSSKEPRSGHMSRDTAQAQFRDLCRKANVPMPRSIHDLRHTVARQMIRDGEDLVTIQGYLRHRDLRSTQVYLKDENSAIVERRMAQRAARFL